MCGIAGWVSYSRDLTRHPGELDAMVATMALRGPDAGGVWRGPHAALGHRRLAVIDLEGGAQPMAAEDAGQVSAVITYSGEVYNFRELRDELRRRGHGFRTASDTEVVLRAYLEWGVGFAERLNGMFAFAIWDARTEELLLVRDRMGVKPLFYHVTEDGVLFGSEHKAILAHPAAEAVVDLDGLREVFGLTMTPEHAVLRDVRAVRPGGIVRVSRGGVRKTRYWRLESRRHTDDLATTVRTVREILEDTVRRQLIADVPLCSLLSGGLDSSAVTALAARGLADETGRKVRTFSVDFAGHSERFRPNAVWESPDAPYVADAVRHIGADHEDIVLDNADLLSPGVRGAVRRALDLPTVTGDMEYSLYLLFQAVRKRSTVALSGESADELFGGYNHFHDPAVLRSATFPWHLPFRRAGGQEALRAIGLWDALELESHIEQRYKEAIAEIPDLDGESPDEARMREIGYLHLTRFVTFLLDRKDRVSMATGLEVRVPFCDHRLVEYVFNAPWAMKTFDGREKSLLRAATEDLLPRSVVERKKSPYPSTQDVAYESALRERVAALAASDSPVFDLVDRRGLRGLLDRPPGAFAIGGPYSARAVLERLIDLDLWFREDGVRPAGRVR
ncbi:asparagine synthetase B [Sphaerisporangium krabiense]|uniref:asparagine synthase (glutamine-hydrolyzing) n=1 Tax=Sphaerisporangium krabiense TaxID=763782 RepID=A0A7W8YZU5_9ACTN|nr:asparagine synthase (glutamine-hydrolyzing) [Sphaerisporangium krabiense]MBB5624785.1 asparagine synthase (glutamine-hydrolyzing) [Sphaerisporangium krabiense]GII66515.1 asparagine synthetase B [Sphaerisporangium krabiense]